MRNPVRLKNLRLRFLPAALAGLVALAWMEPRPWALGLGAALALLGVALRTWAAGHLLKRERLTLTGPYAHLRHPLYAGTLLICAGFGIALGPAGWVLLTGTLLWFCAFYFPGKERSESAALELRFGADYALYRARVRALVPALRSWRTPAGASRGWSLSRYADNNELGTLLGVAVGVLVLWVRS